MMKSKILEIAIEQFSRYGVRTVTMEDIARLAGISKKTIYQEFKDKRDLVKETFASVLEADRRNMCYAANSEGGVIEHLVKTSRMLRERLANMNPMVILEIQRHFPEAWEQFETFKQEFVMKDLVTIMEKGKEQGYFRPEIDSRILARLRVNQVTSSFDPAYFDMKEYSILDIQLEMLDHFLHGIFTEKGRTAYNQQKASQEL
jgi:AcrR family transcriptional regulator